MPLFSTAQLRNGFRHFATEVHPPPDDVNEFSSDDELYDCELGGGQQEVTNNDTVEQPNQKKKNTKSHHQNFPPRRPCTKRSRGETTPVLKQQEVFASGLVLEDEYDDGPATFPLTSTARRTAGLTTTCPAFSSPNSWKLFRDATSWSTPLALAGRNISSPSKTRADEEGARKQSLMSVTKTVRTPRTSCGTFEETFPSSTNSPISSSSVDEKGNNSSSHRHLESSTPRNSPPKLYAESMSIAFFCSSRRSRSGATTFSEKQEDDLESYLEDSDAELDSSEDSDIEATVVKMPTPAAASSGGGGRMLVASPVRCCLGLAVSVLVLTYGRSWLGGGFGIGGGGGFYGSSNGLRVEDGSVAASNVVSSTSNVMPQEMKCLVGLKGECGGRET